MELTKYLITPLFALMILSCSSEDRSDAYGQFETDEITISAEVSGRILSLEIKEGENVEAGQIVGLIDTTQLSLQKRELEASLQLVRTKLSNLDAEAGVIRSQLETAEREMARFRSLQSVNAATQQQIDNFEGRVNTLNRQILAIESQKQSVFAEMDVLQVRIDRIQDQLQKSQIENPISGIILRKFTEPGELASPGKPLYRIANLDEMILRIYVSGGQLPAIQLGQEVEVWIDEDEQNNRQLSGRVSWISSKAEFTPRMIQTKEERVTQVYGVKVRVQNPDGIIKIGMPGEVNFTQQSEN